MNERSIFLAALEIPDPAERAAYLDRACAGDPAVRRGVEGLLAAHARSGSFMPAPAGGQTTGDEAPGEGPGAFVGPYKLLEKIGEGGMGEVWVADQQVPIRRRVALKVIKPGMDSRSVLARFEAERQALALMDHPNIAKVLDAGCVGVPALAGSSPADPPRPAKAGTPTARPPLLRHGAGQGHAYYGILRPPQAVAARAAGAVRAGLPGDPARPHQGHHPPRRQAVQRPDHALRRQAPAST